MNKLFRNVKTNRIYQTWCNMKKRCYYKKANMAKYYGSKGIIMCDEWLNFDNFEMWALKNGYQDDLQIDRINNDDGYSPVNCRWVTAKVQSNNRDCVKKISYNKLDKTLTEWAKYLGKKYSLLATRYYVLRRNNPGEWPISRVLTK